MAEGFITRRGGVAEPTEPTPTTFISATGGTTETYELNNKFYKSHTFTTSGNFVVSSLSDVANANKVEYLIVAGGGGGSNNDNFRSGSGGAGGYRSSVIGELSGGLSSPENRFTVSVNTYNVVVGSGGAPDSAGSDSSVFGITSIGGGRPGLERFAPDGIGGNGGSGGGGGRNSSGGSGTFGQGHDGGAGVGGGQRNSGGGGGAGQPGQNSQTHRRGGNGGNGLPSSIRNGVPEMRAGGGGGVSQDIGENGLGGFGGGGDGLVAIGPERFAQNGRINSGGGGGSGSGGSGIDLNENSTNGGSGIVIIRYEVGGL